MQDTKFTISHAKNRIKKNLSTKNGSSRATLTFGRGDAVLERSVEGVDGEAGRRLVIDQNHDGIVEIKRNSRRGKRFGRNAKLKKHRWESNILEDEYCMPFYDIKNIKI